MKRYFLLVLLVSLCFMQRGERWKNKLYNNPNAGNRDKQELNQLSDEAKMLFYQTEKLSPEKAFLYQFSLPVPFMNLGYAYSDNWGRGLKWDLAILGCFLAGEDMDWGEDIYIDNEGYIKNADADLADILKWAIAGISVVKMIDVYQVAEKYNDQLFRRVFKRKRPSFAFDYSLDNKTTQLTMSYPLN
jgi:hypothetical protein